MFKTRRISYGGTAAIVTSTALICGLGAANASRPLIVSALLIAAVADNLTDALSIHVFQESEHLGAKEVFAGTATNFVARLLLCISFVPLVVFFPPAHAAALAVLWGAFLLATLTYLVARERKVAPLPEVLKHLFVAAAATVASLLIGQSIGVMFE